MRRNVITIVSALALVIFLVGCTPQSNNETPTDQKVRLVWWGTVHKEEVMKPLIEEYQNLNPNVTIDYSTSRWDKNAAATAAAATYRQELDRVLTSGTDIDVPDIFTIDSTWVGKYSVYLAAAPADTFTPQSVQNDFHKAVGQSVILTNRSNGSTRVMAMPDYMDVVGLIYNNKMLAAADPSLRIPNNWSDFKTLAQKLTKRGVGNAVTQAGFSGGYGTNVEFSPEVFSLLMLQNDVSIFGTDGLPSFGGSDISDTLGALQFYKSFSATNGSWVANEQTFRNDSAALVEQKAASIMAPSWRYREILNVNQQYDLKLDLKTARVPQLAGQNSNIYFAQFHVNGVAFQRPNSIAAWKFLKWLSEAAQQKKLSENTQRELGQFGLLSPRKDLATQFSSNQFLADYESMLTDAQNLQMVDGLEVRKQLVTLLNGSASESAIRSAEQQIKTIINNALITQ